MSYRWLPMLLAALLLPASGAGQTPVPPPAPAPASPAPKTPPEPKEAEISRLVQQLGDADSKKRDLAFEELKRVGPIALAALRKVLASTDPEIRRRAEELVPLLERRVDSERALTPTKVTFSYNNARLSDVLTDLNKQTRYNFRLADRALSDRRVTLNSAELPFWEAMDRLGRQAKLSIDLAGAGEAWDLNLKENNPTGRRLRTSPYQQSRFSSEPGFIVSEAKIPAAETCHCGAVRFALCPTGVEAAKGDAKPGTDSRPKIRENLPSRPGIPPAQANPPGARGGMGGGGAGAAPLPNQTQGQEYRKKAQKDKEENRPVYTVILEIQTEPRLQWRGPLQLRTEPLLDEKKQEIDNVGTDSGDRRNDPINRPVQIGGINQRGQQIIVQGEVPLDPNSRNGKHEIALHCRLPENPGKVLPLLKGCLVGQVQTPMEPMLEVPDVAKAGNDTFKGKDGLELQVTECTAIEGQQHRVVVELSPPGGPNGWGPPGQMQMNRLQFGGGNQRGGGIASPDFTFTDTKGRALKVMGRSERTFAGKGAVVLRITFILRGEDADAVPRKLVYSSSRLVTIEVPFEFKNVPLQ